MSNLFADSAKLVIYTDGGARGNPGPAAIGAVVGSKEYSEYIGEATNNIAEYKALLLGLKKAKLLLGKKKAKETDVHVNLDSELVVKQLNDEYKIENKDLQPLFIEAWNLKKDFASVIFTHIPRVRNAKADGLVNNELDGRE